jgi:hypothetical protein
MLGRIAALAASGRIFLRIAAAHFAIEILRSKKDKTGHNIG